MRKDVWERRVKQCLRSAAEPLPTAAVAGACGGRVAVARNASLTRVPPVLYSFPGSGNTWVRQLLEQAGGAPTGSRYLDAHIAKVMPHECDDVAGEGACAGYAAIKVHPLRHAAGLLDAGTRARPGANFRATNPLCGGLVDRAIVLVRHPVTAFWSDWQRSYHHNRHDAAATLEDWASLRPTWEADVTRAAADKGGKEGYAAQYRDAWNASALTYGAWLRDHPGPAHTMFLKFERLTDARTRVGELRAALAFAGLGGVPDARLTCAFPRADNPLLHRARDPSLVDCARRGVSFDPRASDSAIDAPAGPRLDAPAHAGRLARRRRGRGPLRLLGGELAASPGRRGARGARRRGGDLCPRLGGLGLADPANQRGAGEDGVEERVREDPVPVVYVGAAKTRADASVRGADCRRLRRAPPGGQDAGPALPRAAPRPGGRLGIS